MATRKKKKKKTKVKVKEEKKEVIPLTSIEVLVLQGLETISVLLMMRLFLSQGYLLVLDGYIQKDPLDMHKDLYVFQNTANIQFLRFDHERKLMYRINEKAAQQSQSIANLDMVVTTDVEYSSPTPFHPNEMKIGTAIYIRVS
jgi:hypothetical protein